MDLELTTIQANDLLSQPEKPILLDVREQWEYDTANIEGATLIPMNEVPARAFKELDEDSHILVLCHHGARSLSVAAWLRNQGFEKAQSIAGGIDDWSRRINPHIPRY
jgi:rhodanese-related sulfurtransferase